MKIASLLYLLPSLVAADATFQFEQGSALFGKHDWKCARFQLFDQDVERIQSTLCGGTIDGTWNWENQGYSVNLKKDNSNEQDCWYSLEIRAPNGAYTNKHVKASLQKIGTGDDKWGCALLCNIWMEKYPDQC